MTTRDYIVYPQKAETAQPGIEAQAANWLPPLSEPRRFRRSARAAIALLASGMVLGEPQPVDSQDWRTGLSEPVRQKPGVIRFNALENSGEKQTLYETGLNYGYWFNRLEEPVRLKRRAVEFPDNAYAPLLQPEPPFDWRLGLEDPIRFKVLPTVQRPYFTISEYPPPVPVITGYQPLNEPPKAKKPVVWYQFEARETGWILPPSMLVPTWHLWLSEPRRFKLRLLAGDNPYFEPSNLPGAATCDEPVVSMMRATPVACEGDMANTAVPAEGAMVGELPVISLIRGTPVATTGTITDTAAAEGQMC